jgi:hypothetical protein
MSDCQSQIDNRTAREIANLAWLQLTAVSRLVRIWHWARSSVPMRHCRTRQIAVRLLTPLARSCERFSADSTALAQRSDLSFVIACAPRRDQVGIAEAFSWLASRRWSIAAGSHPERSLLVDIDAGRRQFIARPGVRRDAGLDVMAMSTCPRHVGPLR